MMHCSTCRQEFVTAYVDYIFNTSVAPLFNAFASGFHKVCGSKVLELFQPSELQAMVIGNTNYDWKELEKVGVLLLNFAADPASCNHVLLQTLKKN